MVFAWVFAKVLLCVLVLVDLRRWRPTEKAFAAVSLFVRRRIGLNQKQREQTEANQASPSCHAIDLMTGAHLACGDETPHRGLLTFALGNLWPNPALQAEGLSLCLLRLLLSLSLLRLLFCLSVFLQGWFVWAWLLRCWFRCLLIVVHRLPTECRPQARVAKVACGILGCWNSGWAILAAEKTSLVFVTANVQARAKQHQNQRQNSTITAKASDPTWQASETASAHARQAAVFVLVCCLR